MANPLAAILNKLQDPSPSILNRLEQLSSQLSFMVSSLEPNGDRFGTLTASKRNTKPFIIGFIPPDNPVNFVPISTTQNSLNSRQIIPGIVDTQDRPSSGGVDSLPDEFFLSIRDMATRIHAKPEDILAVMSFESNFRSDALNKTSGARGLIQFTTDGAPAADMDRQTFDNFRNIGPVGQLPYVEAYFRNKSGGAPYTSTLSLYLAVAKSYVRNPESQLDTVLYPKGSPGAIQNPSWSNNGTTDVTIGSVAATVSTFKHTKAYRAAVSRYNSVTSSNAGGVTTTQNDLSTVPTDLNNIDRGIMNYGFSTDYEDPLADPMGRNFTLADSHRQQIVATQVLELQQQINFISNIPPLIMLVNPFEFTLSCEHNTDDSPTGRYGHIIHRWQEKPQEISARGRSAAQYIVSSEGIGGLSNFFRVHSLGYQNLLSLATIYKNNGVIFGGSLSDPGIPIIAMSLFIYYDNHIYIGSFDNFSIDDEGTKPFNLEYNFSFNVRYDLELNGINENLDSQIIKGLGF